MHKDRRESEGMMKLLGYYKALFRMPENLNHYSQADLRAAEKKFLKYILMGHVPSKREHAQRYLMKSAC